MNKLIALSLSTFFLISCNTSANGTNPSPSPSGSDGNVNITEGLVAYFPFNGDTKSSDGKITGTIEGEASLTKDRNGNDASAYNFNGSEQYIKVDLDINSEKYPDLTMTAWAKTSIDNTENVYQVISHDDGGYDRSLGIDYRGDKGFGWSAFGGSCGVLGGVNIEKDKWTFLAVTYSEGKKTVNLYVNDQKINMTDCSSGAGYSYLYIGSNPSHGEYFNGDIDEVRIYGRELSEEEIKSIYQMK